MTIKKLIELSRDDFKPPTLTPEQIEEHHLRIEQFNKECAERHRNRIPTQEQLNKLIDYGVRNP